MSPDDVLAVVIAVAIIIELTTDESYYSTRRWNVLR